MATASPAPRSRGVQRGASIAAPPAAAAATTAIFGVSPGKSSSTAAPTASIEPRRMRGRSAAATSGSHSAMAEAAGLSPKCRCAGTSLRPRTAARTALPVAWSSAASSSPAAKPQQAASIKRRLAPSSSAATARQAAAPSRRKPPIWTEVPSALRGCNAQSALAAPQANSASPAQSGGAPRPGPGAMPLPVPQHAGGQGEERDRRQRLGLQHRRGRRDRQSDSQRRAPARSRAMPAAARPPPWAQRPCSPPCSHGGDALAPELHGQLVQRAAEAVEHLVDLLLGDDEGRREGHGVAGQGAQDEAVLLAELGEPRARPCGRGRSRSAFPCSPPAPPRPPCRCRAPRRSADGPRSARATAAGGAGRPASHARRSRSRRRSSASRSPPPPARDGRNR